ncbi:MULTISPECIES: hypothetical protein [Rhodococcus]|uniref:hypothetical protein n=1 Tax=Rhodococcus TaxID=1827 RepID=UPI0013572404|nr:MULTISPECIES: hypothetical protein [Rhodococcus]KAF0956754.1 hypothetical protein MLGJGCBP_10162 [Rhodococcus sp. T7]KAF0966588.1 hypothetical protein MLGJGCBP_00263 [Rhodococcus sp. T7]UOT08350.1 hypothetical protein MPY17_39335 [Rhodococcus opacus]
MEDNPLQLLYRSIETHRKTAFGLLFLVGAGFIAVGLLVAPGWGPVWQSVGASLIASAIALGVTYILIDQLKERTDRLSSGEESRKQLQELIEDSHAQFHKFFIESLPVAVFPGSSTPSRTFRDAFVDALRGSAVDHNRFYYYKGDSANFAAFRLQKGSGHPEFESLQISMFILDPTKRDVVEEYARLYEEREPNRVPDIRGKVAELTDDIFISLVTFFDIRKSVRTNVYLHSDMPLYRCELVNNNMFLAYYIDHNTYQESLQFDNSSLAYKAYIRAVTRALIKPANRIEFWDGNGSGSQIDTEKKLMDLLKRCGCGVELDVLRARRAERFGLYEQRLQAAGICVDDLF